MIGNIGPVDYASVTPPPRYACGSCAAKGVKLWREYNTIASHNSLRCADCACREENKDGRMLTVEQLDTGKVRVRDTSQDRAFGSSDQIGWRVPAVPTAEGDTYWGYTSVPREGCAWWYRLPLRIEAK